MKRQAHILDKWVKWKIGLRAGQVLTRELIKDYQLRRLTAVLAAAKRGGPFYRRHLAGYQVRVFGDYADLAAVPFTTGEDLKNQGLQMLCVSQSEIERVVTLDSSGTTGRPKRVFFTSADQGLTVDFFKQGMATLTAPGETVLILLPGERPGSLPDLLARALTEMGVRPIRFGIGHSLHALLRKLRDTKADVVVGVPMHLLALARYYESLAEKPPLYLKRLLLTTDYVARSAVGQIQRIWDCEVFRYFGMTELGLGGGIECRRHHGYHLFEGDFLFEVVDPDTGVILADGEYGELVVTTLTRTGMPLVRYCTGDLACLTRVPCGCGSVLARLTNVKVRKQGVVCVDAGHYISMGDLDELLAGLPGVVDFTAVLTFQSELPALGIKVQTLGDITSRSRIRTALSVHPALRVLAAAGRLHVAAEVIKDPARYRPRAGKRRIHER